MCNIIAVVKKISDKICNINRITVPPHITQRTNIVTMLILVLLLGKVVL